MTSQTDAVVETTPCMMMGEAMARYKHDEITAAEAVNIILEQAKRLSAPLPAPQVPDKVGDGAARSLGRSEAQWDGLERLAKSTEGALASGWWIDVCGWNDDEGDDAFSINSARHGCFAKVVTRTTEGCELEYDDVASFIVVANPATVLELITAARQGRGGDEATQSRSAPQRGYAASEIGGLIAKREAEYEDALATLTIEPDVSSLDELSRSIFGAMQDCPAMSSDKIADFIARALWPKIASSQPAGEHDLREALDRLQGAVRGWPSDDGGSVLVEAHDLQAILSALQSKSTKEN